MFGKLLNFCVAHCSIELIKNHIFDKKQKTKTEKFQEVEYKLMKRCGLFFSQKKTFKM